MDLRTLTMLGAVVSLCTNATVPPPINDFIQQVEQKHKLNHDFLVSLFDNFEPNQKILNAIERPAEKLSWDQYQPLLVKDLRVKEGVIFWQQNQAALQKAEQKFKIPAAILVSLIGVETNYGKNTGKFNILESLATLAFYYPKRSKFFTQELVELLLLARDNKVDLKTLRGSYAGAFGFAQFMPSSYRAYAANFNDKAASDLFNAEDAIASAANYLAKHGWEPQQEIITRIKEVPSTFNDKFANLLSKNAIRPSVTVNDLYQAGIVTEQKISTSSKAAIIRLESNDPNEQLWMGLNNFYVITTYNNSRNYALAIVKLADKISSEYNQQHNNS